MTAVKIYPWQQALWQHLSGYLAQQRMPQALLITGAAGVGKRQLAEVFARAVMCHAPLSDYSACGVCQSCRLLAAQTHPDWLMIEPDEPGKAIGIDKIRQLLVKLALKPQFETQRVVLINPADQLNNASANAFLKCLEEPTTRTCLILVTEKPLRLPATIRSRCQTLNCAVPEPSLAKQWLDQQGVQNSDVLLSLAQGSPLMAKSYADNDMLTVRQHYFNDWVQVAEAQKNPILLAEQWQKPEALEPDVLMVWLQGWVMDMIKLAHGADEMPLQNPDLKKTLQALVKRLELKPLYAFYDSLLIALSQLSTPINKQLLLEQLLIRWSQLNTR